MAKGDLPLPQVQPSIPTQAAAPYWIPFDDWAGASVRGTVKTPVALDMFRSSATAPAQLELYSVAVVFVVTFVPLTFVPLTFVPLSPAEVRQEPVVWIVSGRANGGIERRP